MGKGIEYTQQIIYDDDRHPTYITKSKNLKFERNTLNASLTYNLVSLKANEKINWDVQPFIHFTMNMENYHYIPEVFIGDYSNLDLGLNIEKNFYKNHIQIATGLNSSVKYNLHKSLMLSDDPEIIKKQNQDIYNHDFEFYSGNTMYMNPNLKIGMETNKTTSIHQVFLKLNYEHWFNMDLDQYSNVISGKIGFIF
jgi:hypothetical protein